MTEPLPNYLRLESGEASLVLDLSGGSPLLLYFGARLSPDTDLTAMATALARAARPSQPDSIIPLSLLPQDGAGYGGLPAFELRRDGEPFDDTMRMTAARQTAEEAHLLYTNPGQDIEIRQTLYLQPSGLFRCATRIENKGPAEIEIVRLASLCLPLADWARRAHLFPGRWAGEMQEYSLDIPLARIQIESRGGRPGFAGAHWALLTGDGVGSGTPALGAHLAWSGDARLTIERNNDGDALLMLEPRLDACEIVLKPGAAFDTPEALLAFSANGRDGVRQLFHQELQAEARHRRGPRKVHLNTWEAAGFALSEPRLYTLAESASAIGVERFVLDDGWFAGRRSDKSSLGDWEVDRSVLPGGLSGLAEHVGRLGMDFGLWVEPEMISPDSELYRAHPDWCLHQPGQERPTQRHQLVLDLTRSDVRRFIVERLARLIESAPIAYLKWDHNRELFPRAGRAHAQTMALYDILDSLLARFPHLDIETCASGGGRVDFEVLRRCHRFWASDNNDAIDRLRINHSWLQFLPLSAMGNHVGPSPNPITGRRLSMTFRSRIALFGHMGVEADPGTMTVEETDLLKAHIALYKSWRDVLHGGILSEISHPCPSVHGWIANAGERALALVAQTASSATYHLRPIRLPGLLPGQTYRVTLPLPWPEPAARYLANKRAWRDGFHLSDQALAEAGLALPLAQPETAWLVALEAV
jgi:alpha-galactosidase